VFVGLKHNQAPLAASDSKQ